VIGWILVCHLVGDYLLQTKKMAMYKVRDFIWTNIHAFVYTLPFIFWLRVSPQAAVTIYVTHIIIDRFSLARYLMIAKGSPPNDVYVYDDGFKYPIYSGNLFLVYVVTDNTLHLLINYFAIRLWG